MLYFFRTPPSVRVGREAIDAEARQLLEQHHPDISFDWPRLLKQGSASSPGFPGTGSPGSARPDSGLEREGRRRERRDGRRDSMGGPRGGLAASRASTVPVETPAAAPESSATPPSEAPTLDEPANPQDIEPTIQQNPEPGQHERSAEPDPEPAELPARYLRLGSEGFRRLRARYADVKTRIEAKSDAKPPDEVAERDELFARAERLNPDAWLTEEEVAAALEEYESVFESLRPLIGRQPRSRRL